MAASKKNAPAAVPPAPLHIQVDDAVASVAEQYRARAGWLATDIINAAAEVGLAMVLDPEGLSAADVGSMFIAAADRMARRRFRRVPGSRQPYSEDDFGPGGLRDDLTGESITAKEMKTRMANHEAGKLIPLDLLGVELADSIIEKDGVLLRPWGDSMTWDGKCTRCGCLYQVPEGWCLSSPLPRAEDIHWLEWPQDYDAWRETGSRVIDHPERSVEHIHFLLEMPDGRTYSAGTRGILRAMSRFNAQNGWPDEKDDACIWKPAPDDFGVVLDLDAMEARGRKIAADLTKRKGGTHV